MLGFQQEEQKRGKKKLPRTKKRGHKQEKMEDDRKKWQRLDYVDFESHKTKKCIK